MSNPLKIAVGVAGGVAGIILIGNAAYKIYQYSNNKREKVIQDLHEKYQGIIENKNAIIFEENKIIENSFVIIKKLNIENKELKSEKACQRIQQDDLNQSALRSGQTIFIQDLKNQKKEEIVNA